jgi:hypothetical protein
VAPPLVIAAEPERILPPPPPDRRGQLWAGAAFALALICAWIAVARVARRDRLARSGPLRYDETFDDSGLT